MVTSCTSKCKHSYSIKTKYCTVSIICIIIHAFFFLFFLTRYYRLPLYILYIYIHIHSVSSDLEGVQVWNTDTLTLLNKIDQKAKSMWYANLKFSTPGKLIGTIDGDIVELIFNSNNNNNNLDHDDDEKGKGKEEYVH